jgi:predicted transcriptional regulator
MARLIDYIPEVIHAVQQAGEINQTELTEAVWGTSGRGNTSLTQILFPEMVDRGYLRMRKAGRAKMFSVTQKGLDKMAAMCKARGYTVVEGRAPFQQEAA